MNEAGNRIQVSYYALFREFRGMQSESMVTLSPTPRALYAELGLQQAFPLDEKRLKVAVNDEFSSWDAVLQPGDSVVFLAPVAGG